MALTLTTVAWGAEPAPEGIGAITAVEGRVSMDHPDPEGPFQPKISESLQAQDVIETQGQSRTKALFHNGSLLTVGENSRVEIVHHDHDPAQDQRSVTVRLVRGSLRAVVGNAFATEGSKFEVLMPGATVVARGGLFVVWTEGEESGAANIGASGEIAFTSGGRTVHLDPSQYSVAPVGLTPVPPASLEGAARGVRAVVDATHLKESLRHEAPKDALREIGAPRALTLGLGGAGAAGPGGAQGQGDSQSAGVEQAQGGGESPSNQVRHHGNLVPAHPHTPPSVQSGAANGILGSHDPSLQRGHERVRR
ncbi:FecR family protein [Nitrospira sp. Kam-Ns4a]